MIPRVLLGLPLLLVAGLGVIRFQGTTGRAGTPITALRITAEQGVPAAVVSRVRRDLLRLRPLVGADFPAHGHPVLTVRLYRSHASFGGALNALEGVTPEGSGDSVGNVVRDILPLGPPNSYLEHNLAHVYTEWILDRWTRNRSDVQPNPAWLYDGIAEWEANRRAAALPCRLPGAYPLPLRSISSRRQWWTTRAGINAGLEYCEAEVAASRLIRRAGWTTVRRLLSQQPSWREFAVRLESAAAAR